jgi:BolA family transcriptional regulator, general stress-responsive regulator
MTVAAELRAALERALAPSVLEIVDESARHHGHAGWREGGETHFAVRIVAASFAGRSRLDRHRMVNTAAGPLLRDRIHALAITALAPGENATGE